MNRPALHAATSLFIAFSLALSLPARAISSKLTYQGHLADSTVSGPVTGSYDLQFSLQDAGGVLIGFPITVDNASVVAGVFTVELDFGATAFSGADRFLQIGVRRGVENGAFTALTPRSAVTPAPYAQVADSAEFAVSIATDSVASAQIVNGSVGSVDIDASMQRRVSGTCASGSAMASISASGTVSCNAGASGSSDDWSRIGNAGTNPATNFIGTTDAQPIEIKVNNQRVARLESIPITIGHTANVLMGSPANIIDGGVRGATIAGGGMLSGNSDPAAVAEGPNRVSDIYGTVGGGFANLAGDGVGTVADRTAATVGGGQLNRATAAYSTVSGGSGNTASSEYSTIGGGSSNHASGANSTVGGGFYNHAAGIGSTISGGGHSGFLVGNGAYGEGSSIGGGSLNKAGDYATISGGYANCAGGSYSWAGGRRAKVRPGTEATNPCATSSGDTDGDEGSFVWADSQNADFVSTGPNQFNVRASGGVRLNSDTTLNFLGSTYREKIKLIEDSPYGLGVQTGTMYFRTNARFAWFNGGVHSDASIDPGAGGTLLMTLGTTTGTPTGTARAAAFTVVSDRNAKTAFAPIVPVDILARVLALPLSEWQYKHAPEHRHVGPMAQDFRAAFGLGSDDKSIYTVDADGVALAAIQGLNTKLEAEVAELRRELASLRALLTASEH